MMDKPEGGWFLPIEWPGWGEVHRLAESKTPVRISDQKPETVVVDRHGKPLITRDRRPLGFRPR